MMKTSTNIKLLFPFLILAANVVFLMITAFIPETYEMEIPFYLKLNFGFFAFSALAIIIWGWYQWGALNKPQAFLNSESENYYHSFHRNINSKNFRTTNIEVPVNTQSGQSTESYFITNGWVLPNVDEIPY